MRAGARPPAVILLAAIATLELGARSARREHGGERRSKVSGEQRRQDPLVTT
jgi:hypothetical protein